MDRVLYTCVRMCVCALVKCCLICFWRSFMLLCCVCLPLCALYEKNNKHNDTYCAKSIKNKYLNSNKLDVYTNLYSIIHMSIH